MKITSAEFVQGGVSLDRLPNDKQKEVAFLGRSNVGKSSLMNKLVNRKTLARPSSTPGKTRELNYFLINKDFYFVDLPGYGYAKVPEQIKSSWGTLIEDYLKSREQLVLVVLLIDSRHEPSPLDFMMVGWLDFYKIPYFVAFTKADKLPRSRMIAYGKEVSKKFESLPLCRGVQMFSSVTGDGKTEVMKAIQAALA